MALINRELDSLSAAVLRLCETPGTLPAGFAAEARRTPDRYTVQIGPVVIITGYGTDALQTTLQSLTRCKVLPKPFEGADLARTKHDRRDALQLAELLRS